VQFPAEAHDTEPQFSVPAHPAPRETLGCLPAFAGSGASTPVAHVPEVSLNSSPF
jgi:hypothetical protein